MDALVRETLELEQYRCRKCSRFFYIDKMDKRFLDLDFGCPYGCDDNGEYVREIIYECTKGAMLCDDADGENESK